MVLALWRMSVQLCEYDNFLFKKTKQQLCFGKHISLISEKPKEPISLCSYLTNDLSVPFRHPIGKALFSLQLWN